VSEGTNRNLPGVNVPVQLLALYTDRESHNAQRYRQTDRRTDGRTDDIMPTDDHAVYSSTQTQSVSSLFKFIKLNVAFIQFLYTRVDVDYMSHTGSMQCVLFLV